MVTTVQATVIISDVHIGSQHWRREHFLDFAAHIPRGTLLVLNGDTIDNPARSREPQVIEALEAIADVNRRSKVIWVQGNHDDEYTPDPRYDVTCVPKYALGRDLFIAHGHDFDNVMPVNRWFINLFRRLHRLRVLLGARPVHVAEYAKRWRILYDFLRSNVRRNALEYARENRFGAVTCGHVHYAEDTVIDDIRYTNTGAWTETPTYCVLVCNGDMQLKATEELLNDWKP